MFIYFYSGGVLSKSAADKLGMLSENGAGASLGKASSLFVPFFYYNIGGTGSLNGAEKSAKLIFGRLFYSCSGCFDMFFILLETNY